MKIRETIKALREFPEVMRELEGIRREIELEEYFAEQEFKRFEKVEKEWVERSIIV